MKFLKTLFLFVLILINGFTYSQDKSPIEILEKAIADFKEELKIKELDLIELEKFLKELKDSDPGNSLITTKEAELAKVNKEITELKAAIFGEQKHLESLKAKKEVEVTEVSLLNSEIVSNNTDSKFWYEDDIRNPISFTEFIVRNPRTNGRNILSKPSNLSSYHYIRPGSIINILFKKDVYDKLPNPNTEITVSAYLKRIDGTIVPVTVSGYFEVKSNSNQTDFEKNISLNKSKSEEQLEYRFSIETISRTPLQAEVNTSMIDPQPKDKLIITIVNTSDGNISFTTTFEYEDFGWQTSASGGFSWVNTINQNDSNFVPAGTSGVSFHYKLDKGSKFWQNFLNPSFGPELIVLQDSNQNTNVGLGLSVSTFLRTVKFGYGWYLVGENGRPYVSIGVNFVEGYKTISSILNRAKE